jgi:hypothetical protein
VGGEVDALNSAHDLADALREAGWEVCVPSPAGYLPTESVFVGVNDLPGPLSFAKTSNARKLNDLARIWIWAFR